MIRRLAELTEERKMNIRGGVGPALGVDYRKKGDMRGICGAGRTILEPGSNIGEHPHPDADELYLVLEGRGTGVLDGEQFPVRAGDLFLLKAGHSHGLINDSDQPMTFFAVLTE